MDSPLQLLLLGSRDPEGARVAEALEAGSVRVRAVGGLDEATDALAREAFDLTLVCDRSADRDLVACCAALRSVAGAPPLVVLDRSGAAGEARTQLPRAMRPAAIFPWPDDPTKLGERLARVVAEPTGPGEPDEAASGPSFAELLAAVAAQRARGVLEVRAGEVRTRLHLRDGAVLLAEGGSLRETLGRFLLRRGELDEADYARVIERMTATVYGSEPLRMGEVLVELGLMSADEVFRALSDQVVEKVLTGFEARHVRYRLRPPDASVGSLGRFDVPPVEALLLRGLTERAAPTESARILRPHRTKIPTLALDSEEIVRRFRPDAAPRAALRALDGRRTVETLCAGEVPEPLLAALLLGGALRLADGPRGRGEAVRPPPVTATREVVRAPRRAGSDTSAMREPEDPGRETQARLGAEQAYRRGQELLHAERLEEALRELGRAVELRPQEPEYRMMEAFAAYLHHLAQARVVRAKAFAAAVRMAEHDPKAARPHAILGRLALDDGQVETATRELEAAVVRDPEDPEAHRGLQRLRTRRG